MRAFRGSVLMAGLAAVLLSGFQPAWADSEYGDHKGSGEYGHGKGYGEHGGHGMGMGWHGSTSHFIRHLLKHQKEIGLKDDQVAKLKDLLLNLDKTRIKMEAAILVAERELRALVEDEKSDLSAIEAKLKEAESQEAALRLAAIKARRDALALLTPEQREKQKAEHEKMMQRHRTMERGSGYGDAHKKQDNDKRDDKH